MKLKELYRQVILNHYNRPSNKGLKNLKNSKKIHLYNSSCGDDVTVEVLINDNDIIKECYFDGHGCSISMASASILTETIKGKKISEALKIIEEFQKLITGKPYDNTLIKGEVTALSGVSDFSARVRCADISWDACKLAIKEHENEKKSKQ